MNINVGDEMEIFVENGRIVLEKFIPGCIFCGSEEKVSIFNDKYVCAACIEKMKQSEE
jgi:transcriptional pleiotropic regulator of transition state genes